MASKSIFFPSEIGSQVPRTIDVDPVKRIWNLNICIIRDLCKSHDSDEISHIGNQYFSCSPCNRWRLGCILGGARLRKGVGDGFAGRVDVLSRVMGDGADVKWGGGVVKGRMEGRRGVEGEEAFVVAVFGACADVEDADGGEELMWGKCWGGEEMLLCGYTRKEEAEIEKIK